jgi:phosphate:Na+ symporter
MDKLWFVLNLLGALGVFLYGLKVMSEGLQKAAGDRLRRILARATANPVAGTISGFLVTCVIQSSSATTVMVVGFCSAGLLSLYQSLGVIFGANIGTTITGWLVSLLGFKVKVAKFAIPIIGIGFFSQFIKRWKTPHRLGEAMVGFGLLFLGLSLLKSSIPNVKEAPEVMAMLQRFNADSMGGRLLVVGVGAVLTMIFQSSSAMMAVTLTAAAKGLIGFPTAAALVLGENIGTTITANLAAIGAPLEARRAARAHFFFNIFGTIWVSVLFWPFLNFVDRLVPGDPYGTGEAALLVAIPTTVAMFHSVFNVTNTMLFLPFGRAFERFILWIEPGTKHKGDKELVYLTTPFATAPELGIQAAEKEVDRMAKVCVRMIDKIRKALAAKDESRSELVKDVIKDEDVTDSLEHQINEYLANLTHERLSHDANRRVLSLLSMINDLERIGDHGEKIGKLLQRESEGAYSFSKTAHKELNRMLDQAEEVLKGMRKQILHPDKDPLSHAREREDKLNDLRTQLREAHTERLAKKECSPLAGLTFGDIVSSLEKMGDHAFNVVEASVGVK